MNKPEYRLAKRTSFCRCCDKENLRGKDMVVYFYTIRNRGQNILICPDCVKELYELIHQPICDYCNEAYLETFEKRVGVLGDCCEQCYEKINKVDDSFEEGSRTTFKCQYWDSGWCYKEDSKYINGCPGIKKCDYYKELFI